jgi:hypothetical protein
MCETSDFPLGDAQCVLVLLPPITMRREWRECKKWFQTANYKMGAVTTAISRMLPHPCHISQRAGIEGITNAIL